MLKRLLLALALIGALGACNTPAGTASPGAVTPSDTGLESPAESMEESVEPSPS